jgi:prephenate dehydrogenase
MTSIPSADPPRRIAVVGTGLLGASIAQAAARTGIAVRGWDEEPTNRARAAETGALRAAGSLAEAVADAEVVVVSTPIRAIPEVVVRCLRAAPAATVTDVGSIKTAIVREVRGRVRDADAFARFVPGHPMGGSERSGPEHAAASLVDGIVWVVTPTDGSEAAHAARLESFVVTVGAQPVLMSPERHDRLVAVVSHLPQVASTALMDLASTEEADEPDLLLLSAGGFRDLTRLAASNPHLWSDILVANREEVARAIDRYIARLRVLREAVADERAAEVERTFDEAKRARLRLAAKPLVRSGVAVLQVPIPDRPGALATLASGMAERGVNIEDLQIVHSAEGGRGLVHLTVAEAAVDDAWRTLTDVGFDPVRLA